MTKAVRFDRFGHVDVLNVIEVERPSLSPGWVLVRVITAGTNPGEITIREGKLEDIFPTTFPCGEGTDFAGIVAELGAGVTSPAVGTEVMGWSNERSSQAEFVSVPAEQVIVKPESLSWEVAGALFVVAATAKAAVAAAQHKVHTDGGSEAESPNTVLAEIAQLVANGELQVPVAAVYDLDDVRQAYTQLEKGHTGGKIVLRVADP